MVDPRLKDLRGPGRRAFLRWSTAVAACLGLERARFLNVLGDTAGTAAADTAACRATNLLISIVDGNGGLSNWTQIFPFMKAIGGAGGFAHYAVGKGVAATGYDTPFRYAPDSPWQANSKWKISAFVAGVNETHTRTPVSTLNLGANNMLASAAAIQQANPTLLPVLSVGNLPAGAAPGVPAVASVGSGGQLVGLFNSAASKSLLSSKANANLAEAYYKAFLGLNAAAGRSSVSKQHDVGKVSMTLLSRNLEAKLSPTAADLALFGVDDRTTGAVREMSSTLITTVNAFALGLTSMLILPGFNDDPHGLFVNGDVDASAKARAMGKMLNGLHDFARSKQDPACSSKTLADSLVLSISGDTYKTPFVRTAWPDATPDNSNVLYIMGGGRLKTGWFGDVDPAGLTGSVTGWDQATGATAGAYLNRGPELGASAAAALLFAVAKGDMRKVNAFYSGKPIDGVVNLNLTG